MANKDNNIFYRTVPYSISGDSNVQELSDIIEQVRTDTNEDMQSILLLPNLEQMSDAVLDELAYQYHADSYKDSYSKEIKCNLIREAILAHRIKGTPAAVKKVLDDIFGGGDIVEWFDEDGDGEPYHFWVTNIDASLPTDLTEIYDAIYEAKNTRSWCDRLNFRRNVDDDNATSWYFGGATYLHQGITTTRIEHEITSSTIGAYMAYAQHRLVEIRPLASVAEVNLSPQLMSGYSTYRVVTINPSTTTTIALNAQFMSAYHVNRSVTIGADSVE